MNLSTEDMALYTPQLAGILDFIAQMNTIDTAAIEPLSHPLELSQRLRPDVVTETNLRERYLAIAPLAEAGLYLVPKVIEEA